MRLSELATAVRSKNAGPCVLTIDLLFPDTESYERVAAREDDLRGYLREQYGVADGDLRMFSFAPARAIKLTMPRETVSGSFGDRDVYGAQQHRPLLDFEL
ncbi:DUF4387 domain-containing protein [Roseovarius indicus]|jgi:hypothetical protein|uniref:DUF4387 domain-containing protein n=1 Tax=Roseovarius indicus TaxID=540747 RepID=A0A0T5P279_9RHOB|nr:DUF4387 domain-containing protein [Roseovarius indicus]KRS15265.1 hypothetical protein XM52_24510 [Roseovarius indicus]OAO07668.1 hypothetical protein A8B76_06985 [Roseovarius indicus]QEW25085.1 hypothetical protein RIdsm_00869 [Roseovarius indicus]SFE38558.1 protein of unknown function [Roseovarius indicus]